ncbi:ninein-like protein isoform X1 [Tympanuchus pallidicinctus]|uniref:ninein-like protein isoform X1 n=2 Tax=Tympanuchus pallidicinctus TaxID=109042 RepID=UPI0022870600|nr:ninein-like protein isoform X1 [Tympanuchus pallidicinctus]XP_052532111.1 ninein-like protein isoform X1 [Tympanuchus pallidicinctus]XP_052532120.1 ninein-like protein isoform X1 [Tympanuchus pallidicinctus]XP_052532131.1 ninein-like protein isoform X1 [Tympanuchus pallidicinctus]XP_052532142.1 ninein-like protein isoform X1 [Tympanuchus pallidicinctus]
MVSRSGLQHAAITSYAYKLQCLKSQVRQISRERDKARLDLEKAERHCLQLSRELDKQYIALKHSQSKLKDVRAEVEAKELLLQQAINHQVKLEADAQFLQGKEATLHGRLNLMMKENTQLQNKVMEMGEKLTASETLVLELQKELNLVVKDKLDQEEPRNPELLNHGKYFAEIVLEYERQCQRVKVLWDQNDVLQRELEELRLQLQEKRAERGLLAGETSITTQQLQEQLQDLKMQLESKVNYYEEEMELMRKNFEREKDSKENVKAEMSKVEDQEEDLRETVSKYQVVPDVMKERKGVQSLELEERFEMEPARVELQHTEDIGHPRQQLNQEGEELRTQCRNRGSLRGEQGWLLEENSLLKSQTGRLQEELREAKEECRHDEKHTSKLSREKVEKLAVAVKLKKSSGKSNVDISQTNIKVSKLSHKILEHEVGCSASTGSTQLQNQRFMEVKQLQGVEMAMRPEHCQQHAACRSEMELLWQQLEASQEELFEAKARLSLAQTQHALQLQQAKAQLNNVVPRKQFEQLQASLKEEQCKVQQLQANLQQQAEQACRQLVRTQKEHERLLQAAVEQAEGLQCDLRSAEAALADGAARLKDAQAQLCRNKLLIKDLREENRGFAMAVQAAELKQMNAERKNHMLEEQALALKKLVEKITPASLSA